MLTRSDYYYLKCECYVEYVLPTNMIVYHPKCDKGTKLLKGLDSQTTMATKRFEEHFNGK